MTKLSFRGRDGAAALIIQVVCVADRKRKQSELSTDESSDAFVVLGLGSGNFGQLGVLLANVRGLRQAAGELRIGANRFKPHLIRWWRLIC